MPEHSTVTISLRNSAHTTSDGNSRSRAILRIGHRVVETFLKVNIQSIPDFERNNSDSDGNDIAETITVTHQTQNVTEVSLKNANC